MDYQLEYLGMKREDVAKWRDPKYVFLDARVAGPTV